MTPTTPNTTPSPERTTSLPAGVAVTLDVEHGDQIVVDPHPLLFAGIATDQDGSACGQEHGPAERAEGADVQRAGDELRHHKGGRIGD